MHNVFDAVINENSMLKCPNFSNSILESPTPDFSLISNQFGVYSGSLSLTHTVSYDASHFLGRIYLNNLAIIENN